MKEPSFWYPPQTTPGAPGTSPPWQAVMLSPLGALYALGGMLKVWLSTPQDPGIPVICVGNLTAGGTGKTPVVRDLAMRLRAKGRAAQILTRGYGGTLKGPTEITSAHTVAQTGDEPQLLARSAPVWIARNRGAGAMAACAADADVIVLDDGFQNASVQKHLSLLVIDGDRGFGNGRLIPAGPLREPIGQGLRRADGVVLLGGDEAAPVPEPVRSAGLPVFRAQLRPRDPLDPKLHRSPLVAFAGIGNPEKFFKTLTGLGLAVAATHAFPDHHPYTEADLAGLRAEAKARGAALVTTEKDHVRLAAGSADDILTLPVDIAWLDEAAVDAFLTRFLDRFAEARP
ncbi:MAG: tetraacyldisaccharide 4'-kinase [Pseudomonadota bacterium]